MRAQSLGQVWQASVVVGRWYVLASGEPEL